MRYLKYFSLLLPAVAVFLCLAMPAKAELPDHVSVRKLSYAGSACSAGVGQARISQDTLIFAPPGNLFVAEVGADVPFRNRRRNCQLIVDLDYPQGWTYSLDKVSYRGKIRLDRGVEGLYQTSYYFSGQVPTAILQSAIVGPREMKASDFTDNLPADRLVWSPCGKQRALSINTEVRLDNSANSSGYGLVQMTPADGTVKIVYAIKWKHCS